MNTKHTPGPWTVDITCNLFESQVVGPEIDGARVILHQGNLHDSMLIAAAPDLLEACKAVSRLDYLQEHNALAKQVRDAITKAEGRS